MHFAQVTIQMLRGLCSCATNTAFMLLRNRILKFTEQHHFSAVHKPLHSACLHKIPIGKMQFWTEFREMLYAIKTEQACAFGHSAMRAVTA